MKHFFQLIIQLLTAILLLSGCNQAPKNDRQETSDRNDTILKVFAIFPLSVEEPWTGVVHRALLDAQKRSGIRYDFAQNVGYDDFESILRRHCAGGYDLIVGDAFGSEQVVREVADDFPDTPFFFGSGMGPNGKNLSIFDNLIHEPAWLAGMAAGSITQKNRIGIVAAKSIPEVNRLNNAFISGAREMNRQVKFEITYTDEFYYPPGADSAAEQLIQQGADVIFAERKGAEIACSRHDIPVIGNMDDPQGQFRLVFVTNLRWNLTPAVGHLLGKIRRGTYTSEDYRPWSTMARGGASIDRVNGSFKGLSAEILLKIDERRNQIISGTFTVPIVESVPEL
ncbi:MAG TPA: BMP family protein [Bacteroidales bacterium]|nr:BMP family protein [Bacteroidales bacterium]HNS45978.1 BMP family protein [Bacteroidales bacterium]